MKKVISLMLATLLLISCVACGNTAQGDLSADDSGVNTTTTATTLNDQQSDGDSVNTETTIHTDLNTDTATTAGNKTPVLKNTTVPPAKKTTKDAPVVTTKIKTTPVVTERTKTTLLVTEKTNVTSGATTSERTTSTTKATTVANGKQTEYVGKLQERGVLRFIGRTTAQGNNRTMRFGNTGFQISGKLKGDVSLEVSLAQYSCVLNVVVDGDTANVHNIWISSGASTVTLVSGLKEGNHTIEVTRGTSNFGTLTMKTLTYEGTLTAPQVNPLQMEVLGDSITAGEGMFGPCDGSMDALSRSHNTFQGYASQTGRAIGAQTSLIAVAGKKIPDLYSYFTSASHGEDTTHKDIVVINLGTNDFGFSSMAPASAMKSLPDNCKKLIAAVRNKYGKDTYIIWTYGMMFTKDGDFMKQLVEDYAKEQNDDRIMYCDLSAAQDNQGHGKHPSQAGNDKAAKILTDFIKTNCKDILE